MGMYEWIHDRVQGKPMPVGGVVNSGEGTGTRTAS